MRKKVGIIKRLFCLLLIFLLSINSFAAIVSDNDGSAFITKSEFDALKSSFQSQIDSYNNSIDSKIDGAIASYLSGIKLASEMVVDNYCKQYGELNGGVYWDNNFANINSNQYMAAGFRQKMFLCSQNGSQFPKQQGYYVIGQLFCEPRFVVDNATTKKISGVYGATGMLFDDVKSWGYYMNLPESATPALPASLHSGGSQAGPGMQKHTKVGQEYYMCMDWAGGAGGGSSSWNQGNSTAKLILDPLDKLDARYYVMITNKTTLTDNEYYILKNKESISWSGNDDDLAGYRISVSDFVSTANWNWTNWVEKTPNDTNNSYKYKMAGNRSESYYKGSNKIGSYWEWYQGWNTSSVQGYTPFHSNFGPYMWANCWVKACGNFTDADSWSYSDLLSICDRNKGLTNGLVIVDKKNIKNGKLKLTYKISGSDSRVVFYQSNAAQSTWDGARSTVTSLPIRTAGTTYTDIIDVETGKDVFMVIVPTSTSRAKLEDMETILTTS